MNRATTNWKFWLGLLIAMLGIGWVFDSKADDITFTWTNPTETFTMTTAGPYTNPDGTKLYMEVADITDPNAESFVLPNMKPGTYRFVAVSYDDQGVSSPVSSATEKVVTEFVTTNIVVKIVTKTQLVPGQPGTFLLLGVGTIPLGTPCILGTEVNDHYAVPFDDIVWSDPNRNNGTAELPLLVVAECG